MQRFTDLAVWQRAHSLVLSVYRQTRDFPDEERFGLTAQLRRAVLSVPTNIAEGSKRRTRQDYARFLNIAEGSTAESQSLVIVARDLEFVAAAAAEILLEELDHVARMLCALRIKVERG